MLLELSKKDDSKVDFVHEGHNVTVGHLKNIVTDKPTPLVGPTPTLVQAAKPASKLIQKSV